jgi:hypothetical protein
MVDDFFGSYSGGDVAPEFDESVFDPNYGGEFGDVVGETVFDPNYGGELSPVMGGGDESVFDPNFSSTLTPAEAAKLINADTSGFLKKLFTDKDGNLNLKALGGIGGGILGALGALRPDTKKVGYQGSIPKYDAVRNMVTAPPTRAQGYRPGQGGINYGGDVSYVPKGTAPTAPATGSAGTGDKTPPPDSYNDDIPYYMREPEYDGEKYYTHEYTDQDRKRDEYLRSMNPTFRADRETEKAKIANLGSTGGAGVGIGDFMRRQISNLGSTGGIGDVSYVPKGTAPTAPANSGIATLPTAPTAQRMQSIDEFEPQMTPETFSTTMQDFEKMVAKQNMASGGIAGLARGRYLQGGTDGMADKIPARIGKDQPAALSHGEFVIPADVVSHLGNGNSDAGAKKLYSMMDKIRQARTGTKKQGKQINPDKFMPGGLAQAYASGGSVQRFNTGGAAVSGLGTAANAGVTGSETTPNTFAGEYIGDMLGRTKALATSPYQQYMGPLTAGESGLQSKVFSGLQNINFPGNLGASFSSAGAPTIGADGKPVGGGANPASQYMNPYLQSVLDPQMAELRRQNEITNMGANAKLTGAGAFGGGRQAIMNAENNRNLMQEMNKTVGAGYSNAFDKAMGQFNTEQARDLGLARFMSDQGGQQRGIEAEGIAADKAEFEKARKNPYEMLQFEQSMLQGMPISATNIETTKPSTLQEAIKGAGGLAGMFPNQSNVSFGDLTTAMKKLGFDI